MKNLLRIFTLLFLTIPLFAEDATICTRDWVIWDEGEVMLGEIADIFGLDRLLVARLNSVYLCDAPVLGEAIRLTRSDIRRKLEQAGFFKSSIQFTGAFETVISSESGMDFLDDPLASAVLNYMHVHYAQVGEEFDLHFRHIPELSKRHAKDVEYRIALSPNQRFKGNIVVIVEALENGVTLKKYPVSVKVQTFSEVLVAKRNIELRSALDPQWFVFEKRETTNLREPPVVSYDFIAGKQAVRIITKNSILTVNEVEQVPAIKQGEIITIALKTDNFSITAQGRARKSGGVGETIPVINLASLKQINAVVIDSNTVAVEY